MRAGAPGGHGRSMNQIRADQRLSFVRPREKQRVVSLAATPQAVDIDVATTALLVVDMQNDFCHPDGWFAAKGIDASPIAPVLPMIERLTSASRAAGIPVLWLNWGVRADRANLPRLTLAKGRAGGTPTYGDRSPSGRGRILVRDDWGAAIVDDLTVDASDIVVHKHRISGFWDNELDSVLRQQGITTLLFAGINIDRCVFSTLQDANFLGYDCILVEDACATVSPDFVRDAVIFLVRQLHGVVAKSDALLSAIGKPGSGDINALIELAAKKPEDAPIAVYVIFNQPPFTVAVKAESAIKSPKDFEGKTLGGAANDGALKLFPAFCKLAKIDCSKVNITNMQPNLREQMLMQGQVDGVFGYLNTIRFSAKLMGVEDKQLRYINHGDYGMDLYSNAIIVSQKLTKEKPEAVRGLVRAINRGILDSLKDLDASVAAVAKREPLIKVGVERERFEATLKDEMNHPEIARIGLGNVDTARLKKSIDILVDANALPRTPSVDEIFTPAFLPPAEDLPKKLF